MKRRSACDTDKTTRLAEPEHYEDSRRGVGGFGPGVSESFPAVQVRIISGRPQALFSVGFSWGVACVLLFLFDDMAPIALIWLLLMDRWMNE